ncbi:MAG: hypothetical protein KDA80_24430, partial [Planctomycetaceae bacterium]|nr:hypothetical protein [Planctomycetaceae bacterium]
TGSVGINSKPTSHNLDTYEARLPEWMRFNAGARFAGTVSDNLVLVHQPDNGPHGIACRPNRKDSASVE